VNPLALIANLRTQLDGPRDGALLRYSLGQALLETGERAEALTQLQRAVSMDAAYSAAWKLLGKALLADEQPEAAADAWRHGLEAAQRRGDKQAEKEMQVFLRRLHKPAP
jgi:tetratricopeptide (TPR) repeat protein